MCLSVSSYHEQFVEKSLNVNEFIERANSHGFEAVELCDLSIEKTNKSYLDELSQHLLNNDVKVVCIAVRNDFSLSCPQKKSENVLHVRKWIRIANELRVPFIRIWAGKSSASDEAYLRIIENIKSVLPDARKFNVTMVLENHGGITINPDVCLRIIKEVNSPYLKLCPDFGHFLKDDQIEGFKKFIPHTKHIHAKTHEFDEEGDEINIDYNKLMNILKKVNFDGYLSIEYEGGRDHDEGIIKSKKLIEKYIN